MLQANFLLLADFNWFSLIIASFFSLKFFSVRYYPWPVFDGTPLCG
ncbi:hypothetical protein MuYL_4418 [Mucilaginibacter xinganensis]|uniref:Uncharacterized protein n=1 Tax=Mucilaginibacter xinganensis TaxID=1234841 RepID=A0A223P2E7_9SPHI|nr:hypothetical protein MuYL_4418 [Mucilaginibacter xinganensis]